MLIGTCHKIVQLLLVLAVSSESYTHEYKNLPNWICMHVKILQNKRLLKNVARKFGIVY